MIKIFTNKLDILGMKLEGSLVVNDLVTDEIKDRLVSDLDYDLRVSLLSEGVLVSGYADLTLREECSKCLNYFEMDVVNEKINIFLENPIPEVIDITEKILEEIMIKMPAYPICDEDCEGICQGCGVNLNEEYCECSNEASDEEIEENPWSGLDNLKL